MGIWLCALGLGGPSFAWAQEQAVEVQEAVPAIQIRRAVRLQFPAVAVDAPVIEGNQTPAQGQIVPAKTSVWRYSDQAEPPATNWKDPDFDDSNWPQGTAPLGYGDPDIVTTIPFGDADNKRLSSYFRLKFAGTPIAEGDQLFGAISVDDGAIVYLNGEEVHRHNLPAGELANDATAQEAVSGETEQAIWEFAIDKSKLKTDAENVIAIRVLQVSANSSDLRLDFELASYAADAAKEIQARIDLREPRPVPGQELQGIAEAIQNPDGDVQKSMIHLSDGEMIYVDQTGVTHSQRSDALEQVAQYVPQAKFVRAMEGDTVDFLALQLGIAPDLLSSLNRSNAISPFADQAIVCVSWQHRVRANDTMETISNIYNTNSKTLSKMNGWSSPQLPPAGTVIQVPGEFNYQRQERGSGYLMITMYQGLEDSQQQPRVPYNPDTQQMQREQIEQDESLKGFAERKKLELDFLSKMNRLAADTELKKGQWILTEYSVELTESATVEQVAEAFNVEVGLLREVNGLDPNESADPNQRLHIPIGDRLQTWERSSPSQPAQETIFEVTFGSDDATPSPSPATTESPTTTPPLDSP